MKQFLTMYLLYKYFKVNQTINYEKADFYI